MDPKLSLVRVTVVTLTHTKQIPATKHIYAILHIFNN